MNDLREIENCACHSIEMTFGADCMTIDWIDSIVGGVSSNSSTMINKFLSTRAQSATQAAQPAYVHSNV